MKRFWIVFLASALMLLALLGVRDFDSSAEPSDEILAYEVDAERDVTVTLSGGIEGVLVNTWLMVPIEALDPVFPYGIELSVTNLRGEVLTSRRFETRSRIGDVAGELRTQARLDDASAWVCEPRSFDLDTSVLGGDAGLLRVRALPGANTHVLLRMTHRAVRGDWERRIIERALDASEMRKIMAGRSSLGFFDLPEDQRADALGYWERRLTAQGREGRDYKSRRLLIGEPSVPLRAEQLLDTGFDSAFDKRAAINLTGATALRVQAEPGTHVWLEEPGSPASEHVVGDASGIELQLPDQGLRTVAIYSATPAHLTLSTAVRDGILFAEPPRLIGERFEVLPDVRQRNHYRLDPKLPLIVSVAAEQPWLGVDVRGELPASELERNIEFVGVWKDRAGKVIGRAEQRALAERSQFELLQGLAVTDLSTVRLRVPEQAAVLELYGEPTLALAPFVPEPDVLEPVRKPPYDLIPPEGYVWRYTPQILSPITGIRPDNVSDLRTQSRELVLFEQARLEPIAGLGIPIVARILSATERTSERALLSRVAPEGVNAGLVSNWVILSPADGARSVRTDWGQPFGSPLPAAAASSGSRAELEWMVLAPKQLLGQPWTLRVDDQPLHADELSFATGRGIELLSVGKHSMRVEAAPELLLAVRAKPINLAPRDADTNAQGSDSYKLQSVVEFPLGHDLVFPFRREPGELLSLVLIGALQGTAQSAQVQFAIDGGKPRIHDQFFHRATEASGVQSLSFGEYGDGLVWDAANGGRGKNPDHLARVVIPLGDDLVVGNHRLTLGLGAIKAPNKVWLRVVLVGRKLLREGRAELLTPNVDAQRGRAQPAAVPPARGSQNSGH
ncbi:MAG TPA: hypothetical protein VHM70_20710 [Polyangiaceae bacterium]|nr:hypothetical protein [Polyangiaceae bacterium]